MKTSDSQGDWPALPYAEWEATRDTVHMWTQIVGKTRLALTPLENHWWNVPLYVTPRGLTTSAIPYGPGAFSVDFDFIAHKLWIRTSADKEVSVELYPRSVADFYNEYMAALRSMGIEVHIYRVPCEFDDLTPFDQDRHHASYDAEYVESFPAHPNPVRAPFQGISLRIYRQEQSGAFFLGIVRSGRDAFLRPRGARRRKASIASRARPIRTK